MPSARKSNRLDLCHSFRHHGWAAARADLKNEENKREFEDAYNQLTAFFKNAFESDRGGTETQL